MEQKIRSIAVDKIYQWWFICSFCFYAMTRREYCERDKEMYDRRTEDGFPSYYRCDCAGQKTMYKKFQEKRIKSYTLGEYIRSRGF